MLQLFKCFNSSSIDICRVFFPMIKQSAISRNDFCSLLSVRDFLFHFIKTSYRVSTLDSSDEEEVVISTAATISNNSQRKDSASFTKKGFPISSAG